MASIGRVLDANSMRETCDSTREMVCCISTDATSLTQPATINLHLKSYPDLCTEASSNKQRFAKDVSCISPECSDSRDGSVLFSWSDSEGNDVTHTFVEHLPFIIAQRQTPAKWGVSIEYFSAQSNTNSNNKQPNRRARYAGMRQWIERKLKKQKNNQTTQTSQSGSPCSNIKTKLNLSRKLFACNNSRKQRRSISFLCLSPSVLFSLLALVPRAKWVCSNNSLVGLPFLGPQPGVLLTVWSPHLDQ